MTLRTRRMLFYGLVALFLILGTGVTLYAEGWRFDFATWKTDKVGAIYVASFPSNASITLDGKSIQNASGFLSHGTLISDLFPKNYTLSLSAPGYDDWSEIARVSPTLVTEMKYAVLIPANASSASPAADVTDFFEAGGNVVTRNANGTIAIPRAGANGAAATSSTVIAHGAIVSHSDSFSTIAVRAASGAYFAYDLANGTSTDLSTLLKGDSVANQAITGITVNPADGANVFVETPSRLFAIGLPGRTLTTVTTAPSGETLETPLAISSSWIAWAQYHAASGTSQIFVYDPFSQNVVDSSLFLRGHIADLKWIRSTELGVLGENGGLYRYDVPSETLTKIADDVKDFYATSDGSSLAALEDRSIEIFSFTTPSDYYRFNLPSVGSVESLAWYRDDSHLFVTYPTHVNFLDLADLTVHNFTEVSSIATGTAATYDAQANSLYLIDRGGALVRFDFPS